MTLAEYMDPQRFPLTTQSGLSAQQQLMLDAFNWDALTEARENGEQLAEDQKAIYRELRVKMHHNAPLTRELRQQEKARTQQG
jgi:hypothetical protein